MFRPIGRFIVASIVTLACALPARAAILNPDMVGSTTSPWAFGSGGAIGYDTPNAPGSPGGSAFYFVSMYQKLTDTIASGTDYDVSARFYNFDGVTVTLQLYAADTTEDISSANVTLLGTTTVTNAASGQWTGPVHLIVTAATIAAATDPDASAIIGDYLLVGSTTSDHWGYSDAWTLTASVPEPASLGLLAIGSIAMLRRKRAAV